MALFSLQNDEWFDTAPTDDADVSLSQVATALYTAPFDTFNTPNGSVMFPRGTLFALQVSPERFSAVGQLAQ